MENATYFFFILHVPPQCSVTIQSTSKKAGRKKNGFDINKRCFLDTCFKRSHLYNCTLLLVQLTDLDTGLDGQ